VVVLSLFDGISCGRVALDRSGIPVDRYFASEVDSYAVAISMKNYPDIIHLGDIRNVTFRKGVLSNGTSSYSVKKIDLLIGGSPCQSFTFAGKRQGMVTAERKDILSLEEYLGYKDRGYSFEGESYLFWEYVRLLKEVRPTYFLLENVNMSSKWLEVINATLNCKPNRINSGLMSAQNRDRLYWTNINNGRIPRPKDRGLLLKDVVEDRFDLERYRLSKTHCEAFLKSYNWKPCVLEGKSKPLLATYYKQPPHCPYIPSKVSDSGYRRLAPLECERLQTLPDNYTEAVYNGQPVSDTQRYKCIGNGWTVDVIGHIFSYLGNKNNAKNRIVRSGKGISEVCQIPLAELFS